MDEEGAAVQWGTQGEMAVQLRRRLHRPLLLGVRGGFERAVRKPRSTAARRSEEQAKAGSFSHAVQKTYVGRFFVYVRWRL